MKRTFTCIYCIQSEPVVKPANAHIFPDAMGGVTACSETVCDDCNTQTARQFEEIEIRNFAFLRNVLSIANRRGHVPTIDAIVKFNDEEFRVSIDQTGQPSRAIVSTAETGENKKIYSVFGPAEKVEAKREAIDKKHPFSKWQEMDMTTAAPPVARIDFPSDVERFSLRRLAAKVAFERWAQLRMSETIQGVEYHTIRDFIFKGNEPEVRCGVLTDSQLIDKVFRFPVGHHAVIIIGHPMSRILGSFVSFFGLFHFWVVISKQYQALAAFDDLLLENPQSRVVETPLLRSGLGSLRINWDFLEKTYDKNPQDAARLSMTQAVQKTKEAFQKSKKKGAEFKQA